MKRKLVNILAIIISIATLVLMSAPVYAATGASKCLHGSCTSQRAKGSLYCCAHTCGKGRSGCHNEVSSMNGKCSSCKAKEKAASSSANKAKSSYSETTKKYNNSTKKTSSSSKKKYHMPDCDDYEDYEEFMDEWDGYMPDGSDAEDYWEDW